MHRLTQRQKDEVVKGLMEHKCLLEMKLEDNSDATISIRYMAKRDLIPTNEAFAIIREDL